MTKKFIAHLVCVGILWLSPVFAEKNGYFVGAQFERGGAELNHKYCAIQGHHNGIYTMGIEDYFTEQYNFKNNKYGFLGGYQQLFNL